MAITARKTRMMRSRRWYCWPRMARYTSSSVSKAPIHRGRPKSRLKPRAAPRYSASAVATQAAAMVTPSSQTSQRGMWARTLAAKLGIVTGRSLAANVRAHMPRWLVWLLGVTIAAACYIIELFIVKPDWAAAAPDWVVPNVSAASILIALGMLGAIVMPHNIYLHSNVIQSRDWDVDPERRIRLMHFELADTTLAMGMGW